MNELVTHEYLSTACLHAIRDDDASLHAACRNVCKYCPAGCHCACHLAAGSQPGHGSPVDQARDIARTLLAAVKAGAMPSHLDEQIRSDPALFWLRGEERPPGEWRGDRGKG